ncbi:MAG: transposase [Myxococcota bacterium]
MWLPILQHVSVRSLLRSDQEVIAEICRLRYGDDGYCCDRCGCTKAYKIASRPRIRQCARCKRQRSVTAGTLLHRTRLPLDVWVDRAAWLEVPSSRDMAIRYGIARSTGWALNHRMFAVAGRVNRELGGFERPIHDIVTIRTRRPRPTSTLPPSAPAAIRAFNDRARLDPEASRIVRVGLLAGDICVRHTRIALEWGELEPPMPSYELLPWDHDGRRACNFAGLMIAQRRPSIRWAARWSDAAALHWNRQTEKFRPRLAPRIGGIPSLFAVALTCPPRPLARLDPWWDDHSTAHTGSASISAVDRGTIGASATGSDTESSTSRTQ